MSSTASVQIQSLIAAKQEVHAKWERELHQNADNFAECVAFGVARRALEEFAIVLKNPYTGLTPKKALVVSFDITDKRVAAEYLKIRRNTEQIAPFDTWLAEFAKKERPEALDPKFFQNAMCVVGKSACEKMDSIFRGVKEQDCRDFTYRITYYSGEALIELGIEKSKKERQFLTDLSQKELIIYAVSLVAMLALFYQKGNT